MHQCYMLTNLSQRDKPPLETHRRGGLTEKNMILVRQVISGGVWRRVINLPEALMAQARLLSDQSPVKAAVTAQLAVAIAILTNAPVRLSNLVQIRLDKNLNKPGGPDAQYMLVFPDYDSSTNMSTISGRRCCADRTDFGCFRVRPAAARTPRP
jgi:hypothetical protein